MHFHGTFSPWCDSDPDQQISLFSPPATLQRSPPNPNGVWYLHSQPHATRYKYMFYSFLCQCAPRIPTSGHKHVFVASHQTPSRLCLGPGTWDLERFYLPRPTTHRSRASGAHQDPGPGTLDASVFAFPFAIRRSPFDILISPLPFPSASRIPHFTTSLTGSLSSVRTDQSPP